MNDDVELDDAQREVLVLKAQPKPPRGLRIRMSPYPHLADADGAIICRDYVDEPKLAFILQAVREKLERDEKAEP